ncbi:hypothetical protein [Caulobacter sp. S45]|uniref:hypothetical protein n=1 Tax=Caulobacter sp. S45 TaxID=1641861 RepID=UPI0015757A14|nr:hypothetical protein [Caulobacter sp. S45]
MRLAGTLVVGLALAGLALQGCASASQRCGLVACGVERDALLQVTAAQLTAPAGGISVYDIRHYPGATVAWRARNAGRDYQCREARDAADPSRVHFVYCRPAT